MAKIPDPIDQYVGSRVRLRRLLLGLSQEKLGDALGLTFQQVQKYEKGTNRIGASRLQQIAIFLNVTPAYFFEGMQSAAQAAGAGMEEGSAPPFEPDMISTAEGMQLHKAFARIRDPKIRKRIIDLVHALADETVA